MQQFGRNYYDKYDCVYLHPQFMVAAFVCYTQVELFGPELHRSTFRLVESSI